MHPNPKLPHHSTKSTGFLQGERFSRFELLPDIARQLVGVPVDSSSSHCVVTGLPLSLHSLEPRLLAVTTSYAYYITDIHKIAIVV